MTTQEKLQLQIDSICKCVDENDSFTFSVCDYPNWDRDYWKFHNEMIDAIKRRGYSVSVSTKWGVKDILIKKQIQLA